MDDDDEGLRNIIVASVLRLPVVNGLEMVPDCWEFTDFLTRSSIP